MPKINLIYLLALILLFIAFASAQTVYITKTGAKYHSAGCSYLKKSSTPIELNDALNNGYSACSRCKPVGSEIIKSNSEDKKENAPPSSTTTPQTKKKETTSKTRCIAITKKGTQCKRTAAAGSNYCWQHK